MNTISTERLQNQPQSLSLVSHWLASEWPDYYGPGGVGDAMADALAYANANGRAPFGVIASTDGESCGFMALKTEPFPSHPGLGPWVGAAYVQPHMRRKGIGAVLVGQVEATARDMGYSRIYCATASADTLLTRCAWTLLDTVDHGGQSVRIYEKAL